MAKNTTMSVVEWRLIRDRVASKIRKDSGNSMQAKTAVNYAESLMDEGWIDCEFMLAQVKEYEAQAEARAKEQEARRAADHALQEQSATPNVTPKA